MHKADMNKISLHAVCVSAFYLPDVARYENHQQEGEQADHIHGIRYGAGIYYVYIRLSSLY